MSQFTKDRISTNSWKTDKYWCEVFPNKNNFSDCSTIPWSVSRHIQTIRILVNGSIVQNDFLEKMLSMWQPACALPHSICASGFQIHGDLPAINETTGRGVYDSGGPVSTGFRTSSFQVFNYSPMSNSRALTFNQQEEWMHSILGPALYPYSKNSYFNEAEYTLYPGQWERRFWDRKAHRKLQRIKKIYDPDQDFGCRHCIGDEIRFEPSM
jgi:hypothetical protein